MKQVGSCPDDVHAVLCAPTGKAAYNIGGHTIHSLFCIPANQSFHYKPLDSQELDTMRVKFQNLKLIYIGLVLGPFTALYRSFLKRCTLTNKAVGTI